MLWVKLILSNLCSPVTPGADWPRLPQTSPTYSHSSLSPWKNAETDFIACKDDSLKYDCFYFWKALKSMSKLLALFYVWEWCGSSLFLVDFSIFSNSYFALHDWLSWRLCKPLETSHNHPHTNNTNWDWEKLTKISSNCSVQWRHSNIFPPPHHYHGQHQLRSDLNIQNHWFCLTTSQILAFSKIDPLWRGHGHELLLSYISWQQSFTSINYPRKYLSLVREKIFSKFCVRSSGQC